jgi:serine/threonine protein kinase
LGKTDHIALMMEALGEMPMDMRTNGGRYCTEFFDRKGRLRNVPELKQLNLHSRLMKKYHFSEADATKLLSFIMPMLAFKPHARATAAQCLQHAWMQESGIASQGLVYKWDQSTQSSTSTSNKADSSVKADECDMDREVTDNDTTFLAKKM